MKALTAFVKEEGFARVLLVAGVNAGMRRAEDFDKYVDYSIRLHLRC